MDDAGFWRKRGGDCSSYEPGLYTWQEISQMVFVDGWIPVASAAEFDKIRTGASETMGAGTCWENQYTTGGNKKYVQVLAIDFTSFGSWTTSLGTMGGAFVYDGNELAIFNFSASDSIFGTLNYNAKVRNVVVSGTLVTTIARGVMADRIMLHSGTEFYNNHFFGDIHITTNTNGYCGGLFGSWGGNGSGFGVIFSDCSLTGTLTVVDGTNRSQGVGGITGGGGTYSGKHLLRLVNNATIVADGNASGIVFNIGESLGVAGAITIERCVNNGDVTSNNLNGYGIMGSAYGGSGICKLYDCVNNGDIIGASRAAGVAGSSHVGMYRCVNYGNVTSTGSNTDLCGGVTLGAGCTEIIECANFGNITGNGYVGGIATQQSTGRVTKDCVSFGEINGHPSRTGGLASRAHTTETIDNCYVACTSSTGSCRGLCASSTGTWTNCYWDSTLNPVPSTVGTGKTTSELQTPTSNTGIYANWDPNVWDFGTSSDYPKLTTTP